MQIIIIKKKLLIHKLLNPKPYIQPGICSFETYFENNESIIQVQMKTSKLNFLAFSLFLLAATSCSTSVNEPVNTQYQLNNQAYVNNMKDSVGFVQDTVLTTIGNIYYFHKIITPGNPDSGSPVSGDSVKVNYRGRLIDGTVFDQTYSGTTPIGNATANPATFLINQLILGWTLNLIQMKAGEVRTIVVPQELGYGAMAVGTIPAYSALRFDIQLISFHH